MSRRDILIDSGPLVAFLNERDEHHQICLEEAKRLRGQFLTSWSVVTEAAHLSKRQAGAVHKLLMWIQTSELRILQLSEQDTPGIADILDRYGDQGFDFADATLMYLSDRDDISTIFTIDRRHFSIFRTLHRKSLNIVPASL